MKNNSHVPQDKNILILDGERSSKTLHQKTLDHIDGKQITSYDKLLSEQLQEPCSINQLKRKREDQLLEEKDRDYKRIKEF